MPKDSEKLHDWLQIIGATAIVASLIFVGMQLKQSQEIAIAGQYQARYESAAETARVYLQSDTGLKVWGTAIATGIRASGTFSDDFKAWALEQPPEELGFRFWTAYIELKTHDNHLFQYQQGFISEEAWQSFRKSFKQNLAAPPDIYIQRQVYLNDRQIWSAPFQEYVNELLEEIEADASRRTD